MKLVSWNVNGIRAILKKDFLQDIKEMDPDVLCLQETKAQEEDAKIALEALEGYHVYVNSSKARKGYSGTAIISKTEPLEVTYDMGIEEHDQEGRVITAEYEDFILVTVYTPNSGEGMKRLDYRAEWDVAFLDHITALDEKKPVVVCGDLNVAHTEIDIARPKPNYNKTSGYTQTEIDGLDNILEAGFIDTFRVFYPEEVKYSWWNYKFKARERNVGWRIDYFLTSEELESQLKSAEIHNDRFGSDHCPVSIELDLN
ncbi:MAG: exodeoxyribonuclease III [Flammeovirgaceae bacterium]|nr:exodeoxyribonuclease III [Flammeovirgaceae bacterium]|tara:strand:- start:260 stop:1030 length:771 start_codon:yes stop_codon:yes gene_type:complete